ncbi:MAG: hypothetical protein IJE43_08895 [Alphaproteobacteria bacterium]|nr:hypothetical protein [Alphaproteobacteria bacterium]MBQ6888588.1 hypothetical protein [Lachnospiraceae bacterium]
MIINYPENALGQIRTNLQGEIIDFVIRENNLDASVIDFQGDALDSKKYWILQGGMCVALSMDWLLRIRQCKPGDRHRLLENFGNARDMKANRRRFINLAKNFVIYFEDAQKDSSRTNLLKLEKELLEKCIGNSDSHSKKKLDLLTNLSGQLKEISRVAEWNYDATYKYRVIKIEVQLTKNGTNQVESKGHRVALYYESDSVAYLFDPNIGAIRVRKTQEKEISVLIDELLKKVADRTFTDGTFRGYIRNGEPRFYEVKLTKRG